MTDVKYGHYTTIGGLMGIVKSESLWATNIKFLNDEQEFQHALSLIKELLPTSRVTREEPNNPVHIAFIEAIEKKIDALDNFHADAVFTLSFTEETDLLSQWRGYCPNNNGYCVVVDAPKLYESLREKFRDVYFVSCVYDLDKKKDQLKALLNRYWRKYIGVKAGEESGKERNAMIDEMAKELMILASYFKHPTFAEEKEHRIVVIPEPVDAALNFREGRFSIIPYLQLDAPRSLINTIVIGPTAHKKLAERALEAFLEKAYGVPWMFLESLSVKHSKTPYRPW